MGNDLTPQELAAVMAIKPQEDSLSPQELEAVMSIENPKHYERKQNALEKIANSGAIYNINKLGDFISDASITAGMEALGGISKLAPFGGQKDLMDLVSAQNEDFNKKYGSNSYAAAFKDALSDTALALSPGGIEAKGWQMLAKSPNKLVNLAKSIGAYAAPRAAQGGIIGVEMGKEGENPLSSFGKGAALNVGISSGIGGIGKISKSILSKIGNASSEEIDRALKAIKNEHGEIPATGGEVLDAPQLQRFQKNVLAYIPGAGQMAKAQEIAKSLSGQASKIWGDMIGGKDKGSLLADIKDSVLNRYFKAYKQADKDYGAGIDYLEKNGFSLSNKEITSEAKSKLKQYMEDIKQEPVLKNAEIESILKDYANLSSEGSSYEAAKAAKSKLFDLMRNSEDSHMRGVFNDLYKAKKRDLESTGDDFSKALFKKADENFKKNVAPFKEKDVSKFINEKMSPKQMFTKFIKSAKAEDPEKVKILSSMLNDDEKRMMGAEIMKNTLNEDGSVNFTKMINKWDSLGEDTKKAFFSKKTRESIKDLKEKRKLSRTALDALVNPNTGVETTRGEMFSNTMKAMGAIALGIWHPAGAAKATGMLGGANIVQKAINSPKILQILANLRRESSAKKDNVAPFLSAALMGNQQ